MMKRVCWCNDDLDDYYYYFLLRERDRAHPHAIKYDKNTTRYSSWYTYHFLVTFAQKRFEQVERRLERPRLVDNVNRVRFHRYAELRIGN